MPYPYAFVFFFNKSDIWSTISLEIYVCACMFCFIFVLRLMLWILKNFTVTWLLYGMNRRWIDVCFQPWCNPLWLTGLKASANQLKSHLNHLLNFPLSKGGLGVFNLCSDLSACCALENKASIVESVELLTENRESPPSCLDQGTYPS